MADVVGYSRLMGQDEDETVRRLNTYREVFQDQIARSRGHAVNAPEGLILAEFTIVLDAVRCAVEIQCALAEKNAELPDDRRMQFRIGINLGDVIVQEDQIYSDDPNIRKVRYAISCWICGADESGAILRHIFMESS